MDRLKVLLCGLLLLPACAATPTRTRPTTADPAGAIVTDASRRIYWLAEDQYARGNYLGAIQLWRHALLQLPKTESADGIRHALVLRMGHGHLAAAMSTRQVDRAVDGVKMLERYLAHHESLFGESAQAQAERGQIYELLYELESFADAGGNHDAPERVDLVEDAAVTDEPPQQAASVLAAPDDDDSSDGDAEFIRHVDVRRARADPQEVRRRLESDFSDATAGLVFGKYGVAPLHGPRPLLRVRRVAWADDDATQRARPVAVAVVDALRDRLLSCYVGAVGRNAAVAAGLSVRLETVGDHVSVSLTGGSVLDALGDVCVAEALSKAPAPAGTTIDFDLVFFIQGERLIREWDGRPLASELELGADAMLQTGPPAKAVPPLPPIDGFEPH